MIDYNQIDKPDLEKFPCLTYAMEASKIGGTMPVVLNAADEVAVGMFLEKKIKFIDIPKMVQRVMLKHKVIKKHEVGTDIYKMIKYTKKNPS